MRRWLLLLPVLLALLAVPGTALASGDTGVDDVVGALRSDPVYLDPDATADVDADRVRAQIARSQLAVYVAVLPDAAAKALGGKTELNVAIGSRLGAQAVLFSVTGDEFTGGAGGATSLGRGRADAIARGVQGSGSVTDALVQAVSQAQSVAQQQAPPTGSSSGYGAGQQSGSAGGGGTVLGVLALIALGGGGLYWARSRTRRNQSMEGSRADVSSLYDRLGADVSNLHPGDDAVARQALADAAERYNSTGALLSQADTPGEYDAARRTVVEGLAAARLARQRLGLDPGPEIPPPPGTGPQLQQAQAVQVEGQEYDGSPSYSPGRRHYWGGGLVGGSMVPGGWYGVPFWESMLLGSVVSGGLGGGFGGGGYERGYEEGLDDARDDRGGGGDWAGGGAGSGGGGSFGGGGDWGGDWGGGGGGDWGGGGGGDGGGSW